MRIGIIGAGGMAAYHAKGFSWLGGQKLLGSLILMYNAQRRLLLCTVSRQPTGQ